MSRLKTREVATLSVQRFLNLHPVSFFWTFTVHELLEDKEEALRRAKPLFDLIGRRFGILKTVGSSKRVHGTYLAFWELQKRGSWHLHLLTNVYLDVNWLRPWLVERGWGQQMRAEPVRVPHPDRFIPNSSSGAQLARYLCKYLNKSLDDVPGKKPFSCSALARGGSTGFSWMPEIDPRAYFFYLGRGLFEQLHGRPPRWVPGWRGFSEYGECLRLGYEDCGWANVDPWTDPPG